MAKGLIDEDESCPDLTALTEGTVAAILARIRYHVEDSLGSPGLSRRGCLPRPGPYRFQLQHLQVYALRPWRFPHMGAITKARAIGDSGTCWRR